MSKNYLSQRNIFRYKTKGKVNCFFCEYEQRIENLGKDGRKRMYSRDINNFDYIYICSHCKYSLKNIILDIKTSNNSEIVKANLDSTIFNNDRLREFINGLVIEEIQKLGLIKK